MQRSLSAVLLVLACIALPLVGQTQIYVPDNQTTVGNCNVFPWGSTAFTYVSRIPASFMDPMNTAVDDIWFTACSGGTWSAPDVQIGFGHVQNPIQNPFVFPAISGGTVTALGDFIDLTVLWDSSVQGPFSWSYVQDTWAALGFSATGGTGFIWDGTNDVAFFVTLNNATGTSSMHRTTTEPFRLYSSGVYQAATSAGSGASGLKISLTLMPGTLPQAIPYGAGCAGPAGLAPTLGTTQLPYIGTPGFTMDIAQAPVGATTWVFLSSGPNQTPLGFGCDLLLDFPGLVLFANVGVSPLGPVFADSFGTATHSLPIPSAPVLANVSLFCQGAVIDPAASLGLLVTNGLQITFN